MPLIYKNKVNDHTKIGVWHITETVDFFENEVSLQRIITHPHKRLQHLAGRFLLKKLVPDFPVELILVADTRKPFLKDEAYHFSVSHCGDYAAAIISTSKRVGVDIEIPQHKIEKVKHKFLSAEEQQMIFKKDTDAHAMFTIAWSVKEALFKWYGKGSVDFIDDMQIHSVEKRNDTFIAKCFFAKEMRCKIDVFSITLKGNNLSWVVSDH
jgi:phosphopantetheinyl transferase